MGRKGSIVRLEPKIRGAVDLAVREGRATIDEITATVAEMGGMASRSSVGRYSLKAREKMERYREAQEIAGVWVRKMEEMQDGGDVGQLNAYLLRTVVFQHLAKLGDDDAKVSPEEIMILARTLKDLAAADKTSTDRELHIRREVAHKAAGKVEALEKGVAKGGGLTEEAIRRVRMEIYGIVS